MEKTENVSNYRPLMTGLVCLAILQLCDVLTTQHLIGVMGKDAEANPFVAFFIERGWLWQMKMTVFGAVSVLFWHYRDKEATMRCIKILIVVYLFVVAWNMSGMIQLL